MQGWSPILEMGEFFYSHLLDPLIEELVGVLKGGNFHESRQCGFVAIDVANVSYQCKGTYSGIPLEWPGV